MPAKASLAAYEPPTDSLDETQAVGPRARERYEQVLGEIAARGPNPVRERVQAAMGREGVCFRTAHGRKPFRVDAVPRVLDGEEWEEIERGLVQRAGALEAFVRDAYSDQRIVSAGAIPDRLISTSELFDPR